MNTNRQESNNSSSPQAARRIELKQLVAFAAAGVMLVAALVFLPRIRATLRGSSTSSGGSEVGSSGGSELGEKRSLTTGQSNEALGSGDGLQTESAEHPLRHDPASLIQGQPNYDSPTLYHGSGTEASGPDADGPDADGIEEEVTWVSTVSELPTTRFQLDSAHRLARRNACEAIALGEPVISSSFQPFLNRRDMREYRGKAPALSRRQQIFTVGMDMTVSDQRDLPKLSAGRILKYLRGNYITVQVRVQQEPISGELFLHHRSLAGVGQFNQSGLTQQTTEGLAKTLKNYRSLGVFLPEGVKPFPRNLRTLVLLNKGDDASSAAGDEKFEYVFVQARQIGRGDRRELELHTFATSERRQKLHYLRSVLEPKRGDQCSFKTMVYFTDYSHGGLLPTENKPRGTTINDRREFSWQALENYAQEQAWEDGPLSHLPSLLDAIIDRRIDE